MIFFTALLALLLIASGVHFYRFRRHRKRLTDAFKKLPGPPEPRLPIVTNIINTLLYEFASRGQFDTYVLLYHEVIANSSMFLKEGIHRFWIGWTPIVILYSPETVESIMTSNTLITKSDLYKAVEPWIGEGLITSTGNKWRSRRKIITPAFHFNILNDFLPTMNRSATLLISKFANTKYRYLFDVNSPISLCTLDTITKTAMGIDLQCQVEEGSEYVRAIDQVQRLAFMRISRVWLKWDCIFYRTALGKKFMELRDYIHNFNKNIILERKLEWEKILASQEDETRSSGEGAESSSEKALSFDNILNSKSFKASRKSFAFLDLLLHQHLVEKSMTIDDINEEVSTFMFAGHDTTASNISWALFYLGSNQDIQAKVRAELDEIFADLDEKQELEPKGEANAYFRPQTTDVVGEHLAKMKYLEMVIKETLRITPTVPVIARNMTEDFVVGGKYLVPKGSMCFIFTHFLHQNPFVFENPQKFDPERFSPENNLKRHPFAYIPFSAGPRNCIGQKFAMMETKIILAKILRNYIVESENRPDKLRFVAEMVLKSDVGQKIRLTPRLR